jgi:hypothetical protein
MGEPEVACHGLASQWRCAQISQAFAPAPLTGTGMRPRNTFAAIGLPARTVKHGAV